MAARSAAPRTFPMVMLGKVSLYSHIFPDDSMDETRYARLLCEAPAHEDCTVPLNGLRPIHLEPLLAD